MNMITFYQIFYSYACACKKIKILMSTNNSIVLENDKCDHILLCMAAVLSSEDLKNEFRVFIPEFSSKGSNSIELAETGSLEYIFTQNNEETLGSDVSETKCDGKIRATLIDNLNHIKLPIMSKLESHDAVMGFSENTITNKDDNTSIAETDPEALKLTNIEIINGNSSNENSNFQNLESMELIDCQIELMDQFRLNDQVELGLSYANCESEDGQGDYFGVGSICGMSEFNCLESDANDFFNLYDHDVLIEDNDTTITHAIDNNSNLDQVNLKKTATSSRSNANITTTSENDESVFSKNENELFTNWLDSVIEAINNTMQYHRDGRPEPLHFSIPHVCAWKFKLRFRNTIA